MNKYAYIRVSTKDQNIDRQKFAMKEIGLGTRQMFIDKQSGKDFNRKGYKKLVKKLKKGDELYIKSIDRLGRDYDEIIEQWRYLVKKKEVEILNSFRDCEEVFEFILRIVNEIIKNDINVEKGSFFRIGKKELSFKISSGIFVNGKSLKITY